MAKYIKKQAAVSALVNEANTHSNPVKRAYARAVAIIEQIPSEDLQPVNQWISVNDRLPEIGKSVLIYYPKWDGDEIQVAKLDCDGIMFDICGEFNIGTGCVTHWMSLPEPPKDGDTNDNKHQPESCPYWEKEHWYLKDHGTCNGTKEREPCKCDGDRSKCDYYPEKRGDQE